MKTIEIKTNLKAACFFGALIVAVFLMQGEQAVEAVKTAGMMLGWGG